MLRILSANDVQRLLPMATCIELMRRAFVAEAEGRVMQPIRTAYPARGGRGLLGLMPGLIEGPDWLGAKVMTVFPGDSGGGASSHQGFILLFEAEQGRPVAIVDATEVTAIRTAAASAAATDALARRDAASLAIFGYGHQAATHVEAMRLVRPLREVRVWGRDLAKAEAFAARHAEKVKVVVARTVEEAADADILCLTTAAKDPYLRADWIRPGQHLNLVGSSVPSTAEVDSATVARARVFVDFEASARELAGELRRARDEGAIGPDHIRGSVGQVLVGARAGREGDGDITLFKSLGMIAEDLVAADHVLREAERQDAGALVPF